MRGFIYHKDTGEIMGQIDAPNEGMIAAQVFDTAHFYYVGEANIVTDFFPGGVKAIRPTMTVSQSKQEVVADSVDSVTITGIPSGATIRWNEVEQIADGNDIEFVTDIIGEHKLQITLWPFQDAEVTINAI